MIRDGRAFWVFVFLALLVTIPRKGMAEMSGSGCCPILELRQYTLHPGKRDDLIELFDREFVETQEAVGMKIVGQFRDLDDPARFVWVRGFRDMPTRKTALTAFYSGPVWKANSKAANVTMVDCDNVLLLHPAGKGAAFEVEGSARPAVGSKEAPGRLVIATIYNLEAGAEVGFADFFERDLKPVLRKAGAPILGCFASEKSVNNYPALPVREGANVCVWFSRFSDQAAYERYVAALARTGASKKLAGRIKGQPEVLRLSPTSRSQLR